MRDDAVMVRRSIDEILQDLLEITNELAATTDVDRTIELKLRRDELRREAADVAGDPVEQLSDEALRGRILRCEQLLHEAERARLNPGAVGLGGGATGGGGLDPFLAIRHNQRVDRQTGRHEIERELRALRAERARRRAEGP